MRCRSISEIKSYEELGLKESELLKILKEIGMTPQKFITAVRTYYAKTNGFFTGDVTIIWNMIESVCKRDFPVRKDPPPKSMPHDLQEISDRLSKLGYIRSDLVAGSLTEKVFKLLYNDPEAFLDMVMEPEMYESVKATTFEDYEKITEILRDNLSPMQYKMVEFDLKNGYSDYIQYSKIELELLEKAWANIAGGYFRFSDDPSQRFISRKIFNRIIDIVGKEYAYNIH